MEGFFIELKMISFFDNNTQLGSYIDTFLSILILNQKSRIEHIKTNSKVHENKSGFVDSELVG